MIHFEWSISLGSIISAVSFTSMAVIGWRDLSWRVKNLEIWRKEHQIDSDARDEIIIRMDKILYLVSNGREGKRNGK